MAVSISPLDAHLGYWLRYVSNQVSHAFSLKLATRGVTPAEWVILRELYGQPPMAPSALADRLHMTRGAISKLADRLAEKQLIARSAERADRRFQDLALTEFGDALVPLLAALADRNDEEFFGHLDAGSRNALRNFLGDIVRRHDMKTVPIK